MFCFFFFFPFGLVWWQFCGAFFFSVCNKISIIKHEWRKTHRDFWRSSWASPSVLMFSWPPIKKKTSCTIERSLFHKVYLLATNYWCVMNRDGASCPHSVPLRIPEINSVVDINDGDEKGKSSYVINSIHTSSNRPLVPSFPCSFRQPPGLLKRQRPHFSGQQGLRHVS